MRLNEPLTDLKRSFRIFRRSKVALVLRMTGLCLLLALSFSFARGYSQEITLQLKQARLENIFRKIEQQSGYSFIYDKVQVAGLRPLDVSIRDVSLEDALNKILAGLPLEYAIRNKFIVLSGKKIAVNPFSRQPAEPQQQTVTGSVKDSTGVPLADVTVAVKGSTRTTKTNASGTFSLLVNRGETLVISSIGYVPQEITPGTRSSLTITLREEQSVLEEVVVTALGIERKTRELTYNVQEVKGEELTRVKDANFVNALTGKVAGVTINASSSGIGGGTRVVMRGTKSINQNNNVLYVIDGIPMPNSSGGNTRDAFEGSVSGEGISSLNPEDIASISALTGPSATALYGNQGANGVIVVTTKKGAAEKLGINVSHGTDFLQPFVMPRFQNTYGQTEPGSYESWGAKLDQPSSYHPKDFFQTGHTNSNALSLSGGTDKSQTYFSAGSNNSEGIIRKNEYDRYNFYLRHTVNYTDRLTADFNAMYIKQKSKNMIAQGQYQNPIVPVYLFPPGDDFGKYAVYSRYDPDRKIATQFWPFGNLGLGVQNPYWLTDAQSNVTNQDRYMLSATAKYRVADWLDVVGRVRVDNSNLHNEIKRPAGTDGQFASEFGYYSTAKMASKNTYLDLIATIKRDLSPDLKFTSNIGASYQDDQSDTLTVQGNLTKIANVYNTVDNMDPVSKQGYYHTQLQSAFATLQFAYKNWAFLDATGRYEWPSQLPKDFAKKSSYFYPSVGLSGVLTDALQLPEVLSFAKLRASYAEVGNPPAFGRANPVFPQNTPDFRPAPFAEYLPERTKSYEAGLDLKFFNNSLSLNATVYKSNTTNQLLQTSVSGALYSVFYYNAGNIENKGIEAGLGYNLQLDQFNWSTNAVFSLNRNKIKRLSEGFKNPATGEIFGNDSTRVGGIGDVQNLLVLGGNMSDLYISEVLLENNQGNLYVNPTDGSIQSTKIPKRYIGHTTPDYNIGWRNDFSYKGFDLSFLVDARLGGVGISVTQSVMDAYGVSEQSAIDRDNGGVLTYGYKYPDVQAYYNKLGAASGGSVGLLGYYVYSATNVRLREASLAYTFPGRLLGGIAQDLRLTLTGRNLFMFYNKSPFDPESTASTGTYYQGIDYFQQPSYRSFGFSVSARF